MLDSARRLTGRRAAAAMLAIVVALAAAVAGALLTSGEGRLNVAVDRVAGESAGFAGDLLPLGFAFGAGVASAFNPCGFPMLPTYLGLFLAEGDPGGRAGAVARVARAMVVGGTVTAGFMLLFTATGVTIGAGARALVEWLPWIALGLGVALVFAGGYRLAGGSIYSAAARRGRTVMASQSDVALDGLARK